MAAEGAGPGGRVGSVIVVDTGEVLAEKVFDARSRRDRRRGLLGRPPLGSREALRLTPASSIHTVGMGYEIDVVFCDKRLKVLHVVREMKPWRLTRWIPRSRCVLELPAGTVSCALRPGMTLEIGDETTRRGRREADRDPSSRTRTPDPAGSSGRGWHSEDGQTATEYLGMLLAVAVLVAALAAGLPAVGRFISDRIGDEVCELGEAGCKALEGSIGAAPAGAAGVGGGHGVDLDGDGEFDGVDLNGDGLPEGVPLDTDGDGNAEALDVNGDGIGDGVDLDGDGVADAALTDSDADGLADPVDANVCVIGLPPCLGGVAVDEEPASNVAKGIHTGMGQRYQLEPTRGATVTGIRDTQTGRINTRTGRPVGDWAIRVDKPHGKLGPHVNYNPRVLGNGYPHHTDISSRSLKAAGVASDLLDGSKRAAGPVAIALDGKSVYDAYQADGGEVGEETKEAIGGAAGGWAGAAVGAKGGAAAGAAIGTFVGGPIGTAVGGGVGGVVGGIGGAFAGSSVGRAIGDLF